MAKIRIYSWAKDNKRNSIDIVKLLNQKGHKVRNQTSLVDEEVLNGLFASVNKVSTSKPVNSDLKKDDQIKVDSNKTSTGTGTRPANKPYNNSTSRPANKPYNNSTSRPPNKPYNNSTNKPGSKPPYNSANRTPGSKPPYNSANKASTGAYNKSGARPYNNANKPGARPFNKGGVKKETEPEVEKLVKDETKKKTGNKNYKKKVYNTRDRFEMFDNKNKLDSGKTKTMLKKEERKIREQEKSKEVNIVTWTDDMTVSKFASQINVPSTDLIGKLFELGILSTINQTLDMQTAELISSDYNIEIQQDKSNSDIEFDSLIPTVAEKDMKKRPPIVTIMGHVDHGKTTLLDKLRDSNVTEKESGGITQHIGAYQIDKDGFKITFLDTPGHEAFTEMRSRGAVVTDITILVVASDDGVMPQTKESIAHAKEANTPLIVVINKMDKPNSNPEKIMAELAELDVLSEEWGGDIPFVKLSALTGEGIDELIDYIKVVSDIHEYKASYNVQGYGTVIEAHLDKGRGPVATIIMQGGTMSVGESIVIGDTWGSLRVMEDEYGIRHKKIFPSMPVEITGLKDVVKAGDRFIIMDDAKQAQLIGEKRNRLKLQKDRSVTHALSLEELNSKISEGEIDELPIVIKADVHGSVEALEASLKKIEVNGVKVRIVYKGVGAINKSDVMLSQAGNAIIIGFNVRPDANARKLIEKEKIELIINNIIYNIIEQIENAMNGMRKTKVIEKIVGYAKVDQVFKVSGVGKIAGAICSDGKILYASKLRLIRDGIVVYQGEIGQLKRYKDDVKEIIEGQDCGISFKDFNDIKKGDEIESFIETEEII